MAFSDRGRPGTLVDDEGLALTARSGGPGQPGLCPACRQKGHLDVIVPAANAQFESCPTCHCEWKRSLDYDGKVEII